MYFAGLKGCYQRGYYFRERLYSQISLKVWDSEEKLAFSSRLPLRRHIAQLGMFSVDPGIVVSFYASAHHPYTTLAIDEWMIYWPNEDSPVKVGSTECSRHLVFKSSLHVRLLPATLQLIFSKLMCSQCGWQLHALDWTRLNSKDDRRYMYLCLPWFYQRRQVGECANTWYKRIQPT